MRASKLFTVGAATFAAAVALVVAAPVPGGSSGATGSGADTAANVAKYETSVKFDAVTYCSASVVADWGCTICDDSDMTGVHSITPFSNSSSATLFGYAAVSSTQSSIIIAYRGAENIANWISTVLFDQTILPDASGLGVSSGVEVHQGFLDDYEALQATTRGLAKTLLAAYPSYSLTLTGHSLGGAMALLAAVDLVNAGIVAASKVHVFTAGQPRVGNQAFSDYVAGFGFSSYIRIVNQKDIVPHLPYEFLGYRHAPGERWIDLADVVVLCDDASNGGEDTNCMNTITTGEDTADHSTYFGILNQTIC
ncbi:hypothetical protein HK405_005593 [Cladochytrium tenue]|nr:hypothetical protein HK405_005593 [Cladochytrium tenue]